MHLGPKFPFGTHRLTHSLTDGQTCEYSNGGIINQMEQNANRNRLGNIELKQH